MQSPLATLEKIRSKNVIVFDAECVLCCGFFRFVVSIDREKSFYFITAQSQAGEALYRHFACKKADYESHLVLLDGVLFERMDGFFKVMKIVGWPWRVVNIFSCLPSALLDAVYRSVARNRYRIFGRRDTCLVPQQSMLGQVP